jgi:Flp pilus assembly protein TadD
MRIVVVAGGCLALLGPAAPVRAQVSEAETSFNVGLAHLREGRPEMAVEEFRKAIKKEPRNPYAHKGLGLAYARLNKFPEALAALRKALELNPYYVDVRNDLGSVLIVAGQRDEGKAEFLKAYNDATNPTPEVSARNLGQACLEERNYTDAANWFRTSLSRNRAYVESYLGLADAVEALARPEEALSVLEGGLKEVPGDPALLGRLGETLLRLGRLGEARARLEEAVRRDPAGEAGRRARSVLGQFPSPRP